MKRIVIALAVTTIVAISAFAGTNLVDLHKNAKANAAKCVSCHGSVPKQKSSDPKIKAFHAQHLSSPLLKMQCVSCHVSVDLRQESGARLRKQVKPEFCRSCHGPWSGKMTDAMKTMACTTCHADWQKKMAKATLVNLKSVTAKDCLGCHGGRALYSSATAGKGG